MYTVFHTKVVMPVVENEVNGDVKSEDFIDCLDDQTNHLDEYRKESYRMSTFDTWPKYSYVSKQDLAKNGFRYLGVSDRVQCVFCNLVLKDWEPNDSVENEHKKHSPRCPFLLRQDVGNIPIRRTVHAPIIPEKFRSETERLRSFEELQWPPALKQKPDVLAKAGFFYTGKGDAVQCFECAGLIRNWEVDDDPVTEHKRWFPSCPFIQEYHSPEEEWSKKYSKDLVKKFFDYRRNHRLIQFENEKDFHYQIQQFSRQHVQEHAPVQESIGASCTYYPGPSLPADPTRTVQSIDVPDGKLLCRGCNSTHNTSLVIHPCSCPFCHDCSHTHVPDDKEHCPVCSGKIKAVQHNLSKMNLNHT